MPDGLALSGSSEAHVVVHIPDALETVVISSDDELMEDPKEVREEDPEFEGHHIDHDVEGTELSASPQQL